MTAAAEVEVLIVGLGPIGQLLSLLLAQLGVRCMAVDAAATPITLPRAATIDDEVLRIMQSLGLDDHLEGHCTPLPGIRYITAGGDALNVLSTTCGRMGHPPLVSINQPSIEAVLLQQLATTDVEVRRPCKLQALRQHAHAVDADLIDPRTGDSETVRAHWVVGCDGGRSTVRELLGIGFGGSTFQQRWIVVDGLINEPLAAVPTATFVGDPSRPTVTLPMTAGRHRWEWMLHPGEDETPLLTPGALQARLARWTGGAEIELERAVVYTFHARHAERWRAGRVLLAGDAAHLTPPFAGQGLSSGARDVANLAWKLAACQAGAPWRLLDTYERERAPHVRSMVNLAVRWGGIVQTVNPHVARWRDRGLRASTLVTRFGASPKPLPRYREGAFMRRHPGPLRPGTGALLPQPTVLIDGRPQRLDDALGAGWVALSRSADATAVLERAGLRCLELDRDLVDTDRALSRWMTLRRADWVVLRPDRFVFGAGPTRHAGDVGPALDRWLGPARRSAADPHPVGDHADRSPRSVPTL